MAVRAELQIIIDALVADAKRELEAVASGIEGVDKSAKASVGGLDKLKSGLGALKTAAAGIGAGLATVGVLGRQAFEFGKEGAEISQTRESYNGLLQSIGASTDLLIQQRAASNNTIDDFGLMSSTLALLAGTTGDFQRELADATPQLIEIAKAANKLNPALGSTSDQYNSIALGIKRASPLILDNLGITIKIGEANERFAESIGKTVDQLTAQERTQAILNATLESGQQLIEQAGGNTESAADKFAQFETTTKNLANSLKERLVPGLTSAFGAMNTLLNWNKELEAAFQAHNDEIRVNSSSYEEYQTELFRSAMAAGLLSESTVHLFNAFQEQGISLDRLGEKEKAELSGLRLMSEERWYQVAVLNKVGQELTDSEQKLQNNTAATNEAKEAAERASAAEWTLAQAFSGVSMSADEAWAAQIAMGIATGTLTGAQLEAELALRSVKQAYEDGLLTTKEYVDIVADGVITQEELTKAVGRSTAASQLFEGKVGNLIVTFENGRPVVQQITNDIGILTGTAAEAGAKVTALKGAISSLPSKRTIDIFIRQHGSFGGFDPAGIKDEDKIFGAHGLDFIVPEGFNNDSFGPIYVQSGERVQVTPKGQTPKADNSVVNNFNFSGAFIDSEDRLKEMINRALQEAALNSETVMRAR